MATGRRASSAAATSPGAPSPANDRPVSRFEELDEIVGGSGEAPAEKIGGTAGDVDRYAGIEQPEREVEHRVARRDEGAVVLTREKAGIDELTDEPAGTASQPHMDLGECHGRSRIIGPTRAEGLIDAQPFAYGRALADAAQERLDRFELEASLLEFGDELQPFEVSGVVARRARRAVARSRRLRTGST